MFVNLLGTSSEIAAEEALEKKRESSSASLKLKSPPRKHKSPTLPSNLAKNQPKLKLKTKSLPSDPVPMELCSPTSPVPIETPLKEVDSAPPKALDHIEKETVDITQTACSKSSRVRNLPPLKLSLSGTVASSHKPSESPGSASTAASLSSPLSLPVVMTPKEESFGGVPMQAPHPSTEANVQLSSNMHIIVQQPNTAMLESGDGQASCPLQKPSLSPRDLQPQPSKTSLESVDNIIVSPKETVPSVSVSSLTRSPLRTAFAPTLVTTTPAVASALSSTTTPHIVGAMAAIPSPTQMDTPTVKKDATLTLVPTALPVIKNVFPTANVDTTQSVSSAMSQMVTPITSPIRTAESATPSISQVTTPTAAVPPPKPVASVCTPLVTLPSTKPSILPTFSLPALVQPSTLAASWPPPSVAPSPPVAETPTPVAPQLPPKIVELALTTSQTSTQEAPAVLPATQSSAKVTDVTVATTESFTKAIEPFTKAVESFTKAIESSTSLQPPSEPIKSTLKDVQVSPINISPVGDVQTSSTAVHPLPLEVISATKVEVTHPSPELPAKPAPKLVQTTLKLTQVSPKVSQPITKVTHKVPSSKVPQSSSKAAKPGIQKTEKSPVTLPEIPEEAPSLAQPSAVKTESTTVTPVVTAAYTPPVPSSSAAVFSAGSKSRTTAKVKPASTAAGPLGSSSPLLSIHMPTPSPLVTTAMKAPLALKPVDDKPVSEVSKTLAEAEEVKPKVKHENKTVTKKREKERRSASEESPPSKSPTSKVKSSPEKMDVHEAVSESKSAKKSLTPRRSPSSSPSSSSARTSGVVVKKPKSPPLSRKSKDGDITSKTQTKVTSKEKAVEKVEKQKTTEEISTPTAKAKTKEAVVQLWSLKQQTLCHDRVCALVVSR